MHVFSARSTFSGIGGRNNKLFIKWHAPLPRHNFSLRLIPVASLKRKYVMHAINDRDDDVIELGVASAETKGQGRIDQDPGGNLRPDESRVGEECVSKCRSRW